MHTFAFDAKRLFQNNTGLGNYSRTLVANLAEAYPQHRYQLFTSKPLRNESTEVFHANPQLFDIQTPKKPYSPLWRSFGMAKDILAKQPRVFHGLSHELPFGLPQKGVPTVVTIHDLIFKKYPQTFSWIDRQIYDLKWAYSIKNADKIIAISAHTAQDIVESYQIAPERIEIIYQSCDKRYYQVPPNQDEIATFKATECLPTDFILSVGSLIERKNLLIVIEALALIPHDQRPLLVIVGEGKAYKSKIFSRIQALNLENNVRFWPTSQVSVDTLRMLYASARFTIYPSIYEGFGLPVTESILSGTPAITSNISSMPEAAGPGALLIDPTDAAQVSEAMLRLMCDDEICRRLTKEGRAYALQRFSPISTAQSLMALYEKL